MRRTFYILCCILALAGCAPKSKNPPPENGVHTTYFFKGGPVKAEQTYKNGQLNGPSTTYYKSGVPRTESEYKNGQLHGTLKRFAPNGQLAGEAFFNNGVQVSEKRLIKN